MICKSMSEHIQHSTSIVLMDARLVAAGAEEEDLHTLTHLGEHL